MMTSHASAGSTWGAALLCWALPLLIGAMGVSYQLVVGAGFEGHPGGRLEHVIDLFLFGLVIPLLAGWGWSVVGRAREAEHLLSAFDVALADAFVRLDSQGRVEIWSRQAEQLLGYSKAQAIGRCFAELSGWGGDAWHSLLDAVSGSGRVRGWEAACRGENGREIPLEFCAAPVLDGFGRLQGMLVIFRDIGRSERAELIAQLNRRLSEKVEELARTNDELEHANRSRADLLSLALHEVRAPLAGIAGATEKIESRCENPTVECSRMLGVVRRQVSRLEGFAGQVLKAAQIEAGSLLLEREPTTVAAIVQQVEENFRAGNPDRPLGVSVSAELPQVYADRDCIVQVLCNLLGNADKYSPPGALIEIEAGEEGNMLCVSVRDHGPGLSAEALTRAFDKFYRAHTPETRVACGHGLGLYISREIVLGHGGDIRGKNHPEGGAVFSFTLPAFP